MSNESINAINSIIVNQIEGKSVVRLSLDHISAQITIDRKLFNSCQEYRDNILQILFCEVREQVLEVK